MIISFCKLEKILHEFLHIWLNYRCVGKADVLVMATQRNFATFVVDFADQVMHTLISNYLVAVQLMER